MMEQPPGGQSSAASSGFKHDFFDVYKVAIDDLHRTRALAQKIDSLYVTILTLLLTGDAYEVAITRFENWTPVAVTGAVALIGLAVTARWRQGASNLFKIVTNRYTWLRKTEQHPDMRRIRADIFGQEYSDVYLPQMSKKEKASLADPLDPVTSERGFSQFYDRTLTLQNLCPFIFLAIPAILAVVTYLNLNPAVVRGAERMITGG